jgi:hypothetical protein
MCLGLRHSFTLLHRILIASKPTGCATRSSADSKHCNILGDGKENTHPSRRWHYIPTVRGRERTRHTSVSRKSVSNSLCRNTNQNLHRYQRNPTTWSNEQKSRFVYGRFKFQIWAVTRVSLQVFGASPQSSKIRQVTKTKAFRIHAMKA